MVLDDEPGRERYLPIYEEDRVEQPGEMLPPPTETIRTRIVELKREFPEWGARRIFDEFRRRPRHDIPLSVVRFVLAELAAVYQGDDRGYGG